MSNEITIMVGQRFTQKKLANMLAGELRDPGEAFDFIKTLELSIADSDLCLMLRDYFVEQAREIEMEGSYG